MIARRGPISVAGGIPEVCREKSPRSRELSQVSKDLSSFQTARPRCASEKAGPSSQLRRASVLARSISSAYRLVVSKLTCPSHPRMTLTSTPDSSK